jgi:hypothetical protein
VTAVVVVIVVVEEMTVGGIDFPRRQSSSNAFNDLTERRLHA